MFFLIVASSIPLPTNSPSTSTRVLSPIGVYVWVCFQPFIAPDRYSSVKPFRGVIVITDVSPAPPAAGGRALPPLVHPVPLLFKFLLICKSRGPVVVLFL